MVTHKKLLGIVGRVPSLVGQDVVFFGLDCLKPLVLQEPACLLQCLVGQDVVFFGLDCLKPLVFQEPVCLLHCFQCRTQGFVGQDVLVFQEPA